MVRFQVSGLAREGGGGVYKLLIGFLRTLVRFRSSRDVWHFELEALEVSGTLNPKPLNPKTSKTKPKGFRGQMGRGRNAEGSRHGKVD